MILAFAKLMYSINHFIIMIYMKLLPVDSKDIPGIEVLSIYSDHEIVSAYEKVVNLLRRKDWNKLVESRFSWYFIIQLIEKKIKNQIINFAINEIAHLENPNKVPSSFVRADFFKYPPLKGLKKKHYGSDSGKEFKINALNPIATKKGQNKLESYIKKHMKKNKKVSYVIVNSFADFLFGEIISKAERGKLTGEWIVYHEFEGQNYYLAFADHVDADHNSSALLDLSKKIKDISQNEFPQFHNSIDLFSFD